MYVLSKTHLCFDKLIFHTHLRVSFQVKVWFQNRRMKWKRTKGVHMKNKGNLVKEIQDSTKRE